MKAFKVYYSTPGSHNSTIVLVEDKANIRQALADKDTDFGVDDDRWSKIMNVKKLPLSAVKVADISVVDLLNILGRG